MEQGYVIEKGLISTDEVKAIIDEVAASAELQPKHGIRNAEKKFPSIHKLTQSKSIITKAKSILGGKPELVRVIFFDKTPEKNWLVTWHQDKTITLNRKVDIPGWGPWSIKDGNHHVQPDLSVLNSMVTFRVHLDDANGQNACLKIIPKSNELGLLSQAEVIAITKESPHVLCEVEVGDTLIMRPHILHSSGKSEMPVHRRVVHIEFSSYKLPDGIHWV